MSLAGDDIRIREMGTGGLLCVDRTGDFVALGAGRGNQTDFADNQSISDLFLASQAGNGHDRLGRASTRYARLLRAHSPTGLDYLILVPTLRCNLSCSYCQVSRAPIGNVGFDWDEATLAAVIARIDALPTRSIKIEFQGGEPTLRLDLVEAVIAACERFDHKEFVLCTNLHTLSDPLLALLKRGDVFVSTSLDGSSQTHLRNRTASDAATGQFLDNLRTVIARHGPQKVSALPTINPEAPPPPDELIDAYGAFGFGSIFLRPINFQGFARKRHPASREQDERWRAYYEHFIRRLIARNWQDRSRFIEETYFSICLRRIFQPGMERHVDLRSPNPMGIDYVVIDHDGMVYPTDEARMLARSGVIDLSIGNVVDGWESEARDILNANASNAEDPTCRTCAFQPFCGRDVVDDIARYGRIDLPRHDTEFCRKHQHIFDLAFELIYSDDPATRHSLARWLRLPGTPRRFGTRLS